MAYLATIVSVLIVSALAVVAALPLLIKKRVPHSMLLLLLAFSIGTLLGSVFLHFLPEAASGGYTVGLALYVLLGFLVFFLVEKFVHSHHNHDIDEGHHHAYHLAPVNLIGDAVHNFIDGMLIAGSYLVSFPLGLAATISVVAHEIPQEIADFGVLLYAGFSKKKALIFNLLAAASSLLGAVLTLVVGARLDGFSEFILPFTAGAFIYIAAANLVPQLHREHGALQTVLQIVAGALGVAIMVALVLYSPGHAH